uniref:Gustatory receptor n=1 Tax=Timema monikensis TaxID=170555 RepID=A0A7R9EBS1_9NEOP|nr:unnamed protein product [Timema monikensis]
MAAKKEESFYSFLRPLALIIRVSGMFPLSGSHNRNGDRTSYRFLSLDTAWCFILLVSMMVLLKLAASFKVLFFIQQKENFWEAVMAHFVTIQSLLNFFFIQLGARHVPKLIWNLEEFYSKKRQAFPDSPEMRQFTCKYLPLLFVLLTVLVIEIEQYYFCEYLTPGTFHAQLVTYILFALLGTWQYFPLIVFIYLCFVIQKQFYEVKAITRRVLAPLRRDDAEATVDVTEELDRARLLHSLLSSAVRRLTLAYGELVAVDFVAVMVVFVLDLYMYISFAEQKRMAPLMFMFINGFFAFLVATTAQGITDSEVYPHLRGEREKLWENHSQYVRKGLDHNLPVIGSLVYCESSALDHANSVVQDLRMVPVSRLSPKNQAEVHMFMSQIVACPVHVSAAGYFVVGKTQITAILSSVATYLIVMIQFSPFLKQLTMR